jgi:hypothetical protein
VPIEPGEDGSYTDFTVALSQVASTGSNASTFSTAATPVVLDSGTTLTYLPDRAVEAIYNQLNVYDDSQNSGLAFCDCNLLSQNNYNIAYQFGGSNGPTVSVPLGELVQNDVQQYIGGEDGIQLPPDLPFPSSSVCSFGIMAGSQGLYLLGDSFLRSAYVVYDLDNHQIAIGQANLNSTSSNVMEIQSGSSGIPQVTGVASQVTVAQSVTGLPAPGRQTGTASAGASGASGTSGGQATVTVTSGSGSSPSASNAAAGVRPPAYGMEAVGVAAVVGLFTLVGGAMIVL